MLWFVLLHVLCERSVAIECSLMAVLFPWLLSLGCVQVWQAHVAGRNVEQLLLEVWKVGWKGLLVVHKVFLEIVELSRTLPFHRAGALFCYLHMPESHHHVKQLHRYLGTTTKTGGDAGASNLILAEVFVSVPQRK